VLKVQLPGINGSYSLAFLPTLAGIAFLDLPTTLWGAVISSAAQTLLRTQRRPTIVQLAFNTGNLFISIAAASACRGALVQAFGVSLQATALILAIAVYFALNTFIV